jgi:hypothetical protein
VNVYLSNATRTARALALNCSLAFQVIHEWNKPLAVQINITSQRLWSLRGLHSDLPFAPPWRMLRYSEEEIALP